LEEYAKRRGQDPAAALDEALGNYLEWERQDYAEATEGIRRGHEDVLAGRTRPADELLEELSRKHGSALRPPVKRTPIPQPRPD
jgi:predicted transcriptional regulator